MLGYVNTQHNRKVYILPPIFSVALTIVNLAGCSCRGMAPSNTTDIYTEIIYTTSLHSIYYVTKMSAMRSHLGLQRKEQIHNFLPTLQDNGIYREGEDMMVVSVRSILNGSSKIVVSPDLIDGFVDMFIENITQETVLDAVSSAIKDCK